MHHRQLLSVASPGACLHQTCPPKVSVLQIDIYPAATNDKGIDRPKQTNSLVAPFSKTQQEGELRKEVSSRDGNAKQAAGQRHEERTRKKEAKPP